MKYLFCLLLISTFGWNTQAQITGQWTTIGDRDKDEKAIVEIYEKEGKLFGKVLKLLPAAKHRHCLKCPGDLNNRPIEGMVILTNMTITQNGGINGKILDPSSGKTFDCKIELEDQNTLKVRGYIGVPTVGRTQTWKRAVPR